ncbi:MAG: phage/plasmid primase, P4 family, partial [Pseudomonadota bacterium]
MGAGASGAGRESGVDDDWTADAYDAVADAFARAEERPSAPDNGLLARELLNDTGNARRLIARQGLDLVHVEEWGWGAWDGARWRFDDGDARALIKAHETAEAIFDEAEALPGFNDPEPERPAIPKRQCTSLDDVKAWGVWEQWDRRRKRHVAAVADVKDFALQSGNRGRADSMLATAAPYLRRRHDEFDVDPWSINVANGTLRMQGDRIGLYPPQRSDRATKCATVRYDPEAGCPRWQTFIAEIFPGQPEIQVMVQRWLGYCLTGSIAEQRCVVFEGQGSNGKSVLMNVVAAMLGDYATTTPVETFLHNDRKSGSGPSPDIARLAGARMVRTSEPEPGSRLSESTIKQFTGGELMVARKLHRDFFEFRPRAKLTMSVNVRPVIVGKDHGIKRRILVVPFGRIFSKDEIAEAAAKRGGVALEDALLEEASGILNWMLDGLRLWREDGLAVPTAVTTATEA